ncbi:hypothetical protein BAUCODRAFT_36796 [Baudoinia panamericana UAMH 10762]|uniref:Uncharacterized protein n=1 Tax=Baudoinia panamericana (strain UAMH 10762) TaxID=717646 RepID=M2N363_BAUPA|nr:uncharacterized protein BAUCODRAFT_36796 [Baudoinia panamericana UAMH 10762]EMC93130.1 hypothetical protein BAUCODRAFT_36796 [Baudoinia panamericana UAMH 10762]
MPALCHNNGRNDPSARQPSVLGKACCLSLGYQYAGLQSEQPNRGLRIPEVTHT